MITIENIGDIETTPDFWDCECDKNYIHKKKLAACNICNATADEQPDSRSNEVRHYIQHTG